MKTLSVTLTINETMDLSHVVGSLKGMASVVEKWPHEAKLPALAMEMHRCAANVDAVVQSIIKQAGENHGNA